MDTVVKPRTAAKHAAARGHDLKLDPTFKPKPRRVENESLQASPATPGSNRKKYGQFSELKKQLSPLDTDTLDDHQIESSASPLPRKEEIGNSTTVEEGNGLT